MMVRNTQAAAISQKEYDRWLTCDVIWLVTKSHGKSPAQSDRFSMQPREVVVSIAGSDQAAIGDRPPNNTSRLRPALIRPGQRTPGADGAVDCANVRP